MRISGRRRASRRVRLQRLRIAGRGRDCSAAAALANETSAQPRQAIEVEGNRRIDAETVRSYFHAAPTGGSTTPRAMRR